MVISNSFKGTLLIFHLIYQTKYLNILKALANINKKKNCFQWDIIIFNGKKHDITKPFSTNTTSDHAWDQLLGTYG